MSDEKPTFWDKLKTKAKSFVKNAISYLPRGIMFTAALFAGSAMLENFTDMTLLDISNRSWGNILTHGALHVGIGSIISGAMGSYLCPVDENCTPNKTADVAYGKTKQATNELARSQNIGDDFAITNNNHHLPNKPTELART